MLDKVKLALRITSAAFDSELTALVAACKSDLGLAGIAADDTLELVQIAITMYCKAYFGENENSERWRDAYNQLKGALMLSSEFKKVM